MAYATEHEKELFDRSLGRRMGVHRAPRPASQQARTTEDLRHPRDPRRDLLRPKERLPLEAIAPEFPAVGDRLLVVREVAHRGYLREAQRGASRVFAGPLGQGPATWRGHRRLPVGQGHRGRRRAEGIRREQEGPGQEATPLGGHPEGLVLKARVHSAKVPDQDGLRLLLESTQTELSRLKHLWLDAGYEGRGRRWAEEAMGLSVEVVRKPPKPIPEKAARIWAEEWAKEGRKVDWQRLMPPQGYVALPRMWVVEGTFSWLGQNRRMSKDYERLCASAEAFVYAAMIRLMARRLARA